jgi:hypothetical protein
MYMTTIVAIIKLLFIKCLTFKSKVRKLLYTIKELRLMWKFFSSFRTYYLLKLGNN